MSLCHSAFVFFFSSRRRHTRLQGDWSSDVCSSDLYYFGNMKARGGDEAPRGSGFRAAVERSFPTYDIWKTDFVSVGKMRGVGWAMCYLDPATGSISNHWITLHETGNVSGFVPLLVMDVWEHAYLLDYKPADRPKYIEAFLGNIDWDSVESRMNVNVPETVA